MGDVHVDDPPKGSGRPDLVPSLHNYAYLSPCQSNHLRWMLQKDLILHQDFLLVGPPSLARDRRHLLMLYAALVEREVEYMALSRDTSDGDLKQRKEVASTSTASTTSTSFYSHQAPVRAALYGRLLILDGLEKAERNVLPTLNNLLENRELSLDDGGLLVASHVYDNHHHNNNNNNPGGGDDEYESQQRAAASLTGTRTCKTIQGGGGSSTTIHRVHPDFRVAALTSDALALDPPLRSRFQARALAPLNPGELLQSLVAATSSSGTCGGGDGDGDGSSSSSSSSNRRAMDATMIHELVRMASSIPHEISLQSMHDAVQYLERHPNSLSSNAVLNAYTPTMLSIHDLRLPSDKIQNHTKTTDEGSTTTTTTAMTPSVSDSHHHRFIETQSTRMVQELIVSAFESGKRGVAVVGPKGCYKSALVRDLAQKQQQQLRLFPLYSDMTARDLLLTRGTVSDGTTLWRRTPLTRAIEQGTWVLLDGIDKISTDTLTSLALLMEQGQMDLPDGTRLIAGPGFRCIALAHPPLEDDNSHKHYRKKWMSPEVMGMFYFMRVDPLPAQELRQVLSGLYPLIPSETLETIVQLRDRLDEAVVGGVADTHEEQASLMLSMRKLKHICKRLQAQNKDAGWSLGSLVANALMIDLMPEREQRVVKTCMKECGIVPPMATTRQGHNTTLDEDLIEKCRRIPESLLLVPNPVFEENPGHTQVLADILAAHSVGEEALLVMGFQGVGKNRIIDHLLSRLACEREYLQLHRDTTVSSLLSSPSVEDGRIVYNDSPLVRAAKFGRILVIDEADKAPVEVVALLKGLIEDRELALPEGRTLRYKADVTGGDLQETIEIHPDFRIWALANPATYPFHGNDISGEMSDVFSCHTVPPLDSESQRRILQRYGPRVASGDIDKIVQTWKDLRASHERGDISYPFSVREAVSVTKHLNRFPTDGIDGAFENIIAFDRFDRVTLKQLAKIFDRHGIPIATFASTPSGKGNISEGGISTPRTRASSPKHGQVDVNNDPHVGGNTWAGGSGGSDTAGLGGRGGPYRLDSGHPVHQVTDEMKAQVSQEAQRKARQMAREALELKLKELDMNKLDWEKYSDLQERVAPQIQQLRVLLKDINRRKQERTWLKRQTTGELDDSRLVDALAGEKDVFKKRGKTTDTASKFHHEQPMQIKLVVDISASMYRFNGYDGRLQTLLEATLMIMEALNDDDRFLLTIVGHNGDSPEIPLVRPKTPMDPKTQLKVLEGMVAHTQYTFAGDHSVEAIESAISQATPGDLVLVVSDANLKRYRIDPRKISHLLNQPGIHAHLILIGNFGEEAHHLSRAVPNGRAQVCLKSEDLPLILKKIVASAAK